jgi:hypothetical protein
LINCFKQLESNGTSCYLICSSLLEHGGWGAAAALKHRKHIEEISFLALIESDGSDMSTHDFTPTLTGGFELQLTFRRWQNVHQKRM